VETLNANNYYFDILYLFLDHLDNHPDKEETNFVKANYILSSWLLQGFVIPFWKDDKLIGICIVREVNSFHCVIELIHILKEYRKSKYVAKRIKEIQNYLSEQYKIIDATISTKEGENLMKNWSSQVVFKTYRRQK